MNTASTDLEIAARSGSTLKRIRARIPT
jgi:hypothetical protein